MVKSVDVLKDAQDKFKITEKTWSSVYDKMDDDLHFMSDEETAQWEEIDYSSRKESGRPVLTIDQLGQFVNQVVNDIRMNTPTINVIPDGESSVETAEILKGLIRNIQYDSKADSVYDNAVEFAVKSSLGFIRVDHDYEDAKSFNQKLMIKPCTNPNAVWIDSNSIEPDGSDAKCAFILDSMSGDDFDEKYPGKSKVHFAEVEGLGDDNEEYVIIAEYFYIDEKEITIGARQDEMTGEQIIEEVQKNVEYTDTRKTTRNEVRRYKMSGEDVLEETTFPGTYIPIVPVYGAIGWNKGKRNLLSLIRKSKDGQRLYNYWRSLEAELLMKQPNAPIMAAMGQTEDFAADWQNPDKTQVLRYKQTDAQGNQAPMPQRLAPPQIPTGVVNAARESVEDIKATMGMYNASIGARSNETSGIAIAQRKQEGDVATFHFGDNLVRSITHVGNILLSAIPEIYDTPRILTIVGEEEDTSTVAVNGAEPVEDQKEEFDIANMGKYNVKVTTGAAFTTQRQEAADYLTQIINSRPELMQVAGDILFKNMDFPGAEALASRLKKTIPPELMQDDDEEMDPALMQAQQQMQQMQEQMLQMQTQLEDKSAEEELKAAEVQIKAQSEQAKAQNDQGKLELDARELELEANKAQAELGLKERELDIKEQELGLKVITEDNKAEDARRKEIADLQQSSLNSEGAYQGEY